MNRKRLLAVLTAAVLISVIEGSPYKKSVPPPLEIDEDAPKIVSREEVRIGDMILPRERLNQNAKQTRFKRRPYSNDYRWPKSGSTVSVPYTNDGVDTDVLQRAIEVFNAKTCIRFIPRSSQSDYVAFSTGDGCNAQVGYRNTAGQSCTLSSNCAQKKGKILHEMMHILGFLHEQCRADRDSYVTINTNNIRTGFSGNFAKIEDDVNQNIAYDCDSILHYKANAFLKPDAASGAVTISSSHCSTMGNDDTRLSLLDYKRVNTWYSCSSNPDYVYFTIRVVTDDSMSSGTDCYIYIKLHGTSRTSEEFELDLDNAGSSNLFEAGSDDTFSKMAFRNDLGTITGITIRTIAHGWGPAWWPEKFVITDPVNGQEKTFTNSNWLYGDNTYGTSYFSESKK